MAVLLISVVICSYRRPHLLRRFLPRVCEQQGAAFEVLVVDNNSRDETEAVVRELQNRYPHLRYTLEPDVGLSQARNRGWQEAQGEYIAYLDDDSRPPPGWLTRAQTVVQQHHPRELGGPMRALFDGEKPEWWLPEYDTHHHFDYGGAQGYLPPHQEIFGANLILEKTAIDELGGFTPGLGMSGNEIAYGEEWDLHRRMCQRWPDHRAWCAQELYVDHLIRADKLSLRWSIRERISRALYTHLIACEGKPVFSRSQGRLFTLLFPLSLLREFWRAIRYPGRHWRNVLFESKELTRRCKQLGQLRAQQRAAPKWAETGGPMRCHRCDGVEVS